MWPSASASCAVGSLVRSNLGMLPEKSWKLEAIGRLFLSIIACILGGEAIARAVQAASKPIAHDWKFILSSMAAISAFGATVASLRKPWTLERALPLRARHRDRRPQGPESSCRRSAKQGHKEQVPRGSRGVGQNAEQHLVASKRLLSRTIRLPCDRRPLHRAGAEIA